MDESGAVRTALVVRNAPDDAPPVARSRVAQWVRNRRVLVHAAYLRLDRWRFGTADDPFAPRDITPLVRGAPVRDVRPRRTRFSDYLDDADVEAIASCDLDVLIRLGFRILRGGILRAARHGVLSYHHGDNHRYRGGPAGFWEVMDGNPVTGSILQLLTEDLDGGRVVYRSYGATNLYSVWKNRREMYWKSSEFLARTLTALRDEGAAALRDPEGPAGTPHAYSARLYVAPTNGEMARGVARLTSRHLRAKWRSLVESEPWILAYHLREGVPDANRVPELTPFRFRRLVPPRDRFWADPFPLPVDGRYFVLFEEYLYATQRGHIAALELGPKGPIGEPVIALQTDWHLSYPFQFTWRGAHWMIPETADVGRVELYRAVRPPFEWTLERVLLDGVALADCTLAEMGGRWWMFATRVLPDTMPWDELDVYSAESPLGPWVPHPRNPVVSDVRRARPAGALFEVNGVWYRPSQDCSVRYGGAFSIQRIDRLDERGYAETTVTRVDPAWAPDLRGTHTVNASGGLTVIDARIRRWKSPWAR
jgi:hypothetical protein